MLSSTEIDKLNLRSATLIVIRKIKQHVFRLQIPVYYLVIRSNICVYPIIVMHEVKGRKDLFDDGGSFCLLE